MLTKEQIEELRRIELTKPCARNVNPDVYDLCDTALALYERVETLRARLKALGVTDAD